MFKKYTVNLFSIGGEKGDEAVGVDRAAMLQHAAVESHSALQISRPATTHIRCRNSDNLSAFALWNNLTQHKVSLSHYNRPHRSGMHCLRDASSKGRIVQGHKIQRMQNPRLIIQGHIVQGYNIMSHKKLGAVATKVRNGP
jgi:hypothetical protein